MKKMRTDVLAKQQQAKKHMMLEIQDAQENCFHKTDDGATLENPNNIDARDKVAFGINDKHLRPMDFICEHCMDIVYMKEVEQRAFRDAFQTIKDVANQIKVMTQTDDSTPEGRQEMLCIIDMVKTINALEETMWAMYSEEIVNRLGGKNRNKNKNSKTSNHMGNGGIDIASFNRR